MDLLQLLKETISISKKQKSIFLSLESLLTSWITYDVHNHRNEFLDSLASNSLIVIYTFNFTTKQNN